MTGIRNNIFALYSLSSLLALLLLLEVWNSLRLLLPLFSFMFNTLHNWHKKINFSKDYLDHQFLKVQGRTINLVCNSKAVAKESSYAELPPRHLNHAAFLVGKVLLKSQKHSWQRRSREFMYELIPEPQFLRVTHNLFSVPQLADSFSKTSSFTVGRMSITETNWNVWLSGFFQCLTSRLGLLKILWGWWQRGVWKFRVRIWNKTAQHLFNEQASGNSSV